MIRQFVILHLFQKILRRPQDQPAEDPVLRQRKLPLGVPRIGGPPRGIRRGGVPQQSETLVLPRAKLQ